MECKDICIVDLKIVKSIGIYPEWNVKIISLGNEDKLIVHWNISRMECKVVRITFPIIRKVSIGIYPEWNVKMTSGFELIPEGEIGIYPEWNVKDDGAMLSRQWVKLEYIQNGM